jgi:hypothetical protein
MGRLWEVIGGATQYSGDLPGLCQEGEEERLARAPCVLLKVHIELVEGEIFPRLDNGC